MTTLPEPVALADFIPHQVEAALARQPIQSRRMRIAGIDARLTVEEPIAPFLLGPFSHLKTPPDDSSDFLRIYVASMDENDAAAMRLDDLPMSGTVHSVDHGATIVHLQGDSVALFDRACGRIDALMRSPDKSEAWKRAKPLQLPLSVFCADHGVDLLHGGLVALHGNGVILAGAGGSGKSTVALASALDGLDFLGDDCVGMKEVSGCFEGYSVFGSSCLEREHLTNFALPHEGRADEVGDKVVLPTGRLFTGQMANSTTIRAVLLPRVTGGDRVTIQRVSGKEALLALAPSSILNRAMPAAAAFARMARMIRGLPAYRLEMGPIQEIGPRVRDLLQELPR